MNNNSIQIERYLLQEMDAAERAAFETQLLSDTALQEELRIQAQVLRALEHVGIKNEFGKAIQKKIWLKKVLQWSAVATIAVAAVVLFIFKDRIFPHASSTKEEHNVTENFNINNATDTIIETKDGVIFAIPAHAFTTNSDKVQLEIKTALNAHDIITQGLSTVSNDAQLQTAGMFYINGMVDGKEVNLSKEIAVSVPAKKIDTTMRLFDGVADSTGNINWTDPRPINTGLRTYDITSLDFYPPKYIPTLKALGKEYANKKYTDSLYYSFSGHGYTNTTPATTEIVNEANDYPYSDSTKKLKPAFDITDTTSKITYQIDPAMIHAIWDAKYNNTILATREFEERLRYMHTLCTDRYLQIYLQHLNKPLYVSDLLCAQLAHSNDYTTTISKFDEFARRHDGGVMITSDIQKKLSIYFEEKYKAYQEAVIKTWAKYQAQLDSFSRIADDKRREQVVADFTRENKNFDEEFKINLADAYKQVGRKPEPVYYNVNIKTTGWKNLDKYVFDATITRTSMKYIDPDNGKTVTLTYKDININIANETQYDKVLVYLIPDSLSNFQRVNKEGSIFKESLNALFKYDAVVLAYKGTDTYFIQQENVQPQSYTFTLQPIADEALRKALDKYALGKRDFLNNEFTYQLFEQQETERQAKLRKDVEFREQVAMSIFNCYDGKK
jgi:hypothetical protein